MLKKENENALRLSFCENCLDDTQYEIKEKQEVEHCRGKDIKYIMKEAYCTECGNPMYVSELNDENLNSLYNQIRKEDNIISIEEINEIIDKYNIGKRPLSLLLGWGEGTITRYLNGDLPTKNYSDRLYSILESIEEMETLLELNKDKIKAVAYRKCKERIESLKGSESAITKEEDKIKLIARYIISRCEDITPLALQKLLYYSQAFYTLFVGSNLVNDDCEAWVHGPVYKVIYEEYKNYGRNIIDIEKNENIENIELDELEETIIDNVIKYFGCYRAKVLEEMTHNEKPWIITRIGLKKNEPCNRIIKKELINEYFKDIKNKYKIVNIEDMKEYSKDLFSNIF